MQVRNRDINCDNKQSVSSDQHLYAPALPISVLQIKKKKHNIFKGK